MLALLYCRLLGQIIISLKIKIKKEPWLACAGSEMWQPVQGKAIFVWVAKCPSNYAGTLFAAERFALLTRLASVRCILQDEQPVEAGISAAFLLPGPPRKLPLRVRFPLGGSEVTWRDCYASGGVASAPAGESGGAPSPGRRVVASGVSARWAGSRLGQRAAPKWAKCGNNVASDRQVQETGTNLPLGEDDSSTRGVTSLAGGEGPVGSAILNATRNGTTFLCSWAADARKGVVSGFPLGHFIAPENENGVLNERRDRCFRRIPVCACRIVLYAVSNEGPSRRALQRAGAECRSM